MIDTETRGRGDRVTRTKTSIDFFRFDGSMQFIPQSAIRIPQ